jgi:2-(3-amino-3-carboxypropyl)histidine synthase
MLTMHYDLELERAASYIKEKEAKLVCIQLPDGLKIRADVITNYLEQNTDATIVTWLGECFGACDLPLGLDQMKVDLLIQWGHNLFHKKEWEL